MKHLKFAMELCEIQANNGLYLLFEHPAGATSGRYANFGSTPSVVKLRTL